jgi:putative ABC transport system substrate-binding protein
MRRRDFVIGCAAALMPVAAGAQQRGKMPVIGYLGGGSHATQGVWATAFVRRLTELGWIEGRTISIEFRWADAEANRYSEIAAEFVRLKVDVILAGGTEAALAARKATSSIPIVFPTSGDPVAAGLVASLARPGGNVTGLSNLAADLDDKRLGLFREVLPKLSKLAVLINTAYSGVINEVGEFERAGRGLGIEIVPMPIRSAQDIAPAFDGLNGRAQALYVVGDPLANTNRVRINTFALVAKLPAMYTQRQYVDVGGLMSYGPNYPDFHRRAAEFVDKILRGAKPADIPVEQATKFDLVVNLVTARALGVTIPSTVLARADEVIE